MKFENTTVIGIENALIGMRLPMCKDCTDARTKSDSFSERFNGNYIIGEKDLDLAKKLIESPLEEKYLDGYLFVTMGAGDNWKLGKAILEDK